MSSDTVCRSAWSPGYRGSMRIEGFGVINVGWSVRVNAIAAPRRSIATIASEIAANMTGNQSQPRRFRECVIGLGPESKAPSGRSLGHVDLHCIVAVSFDTLDAGPKLNAFIPFGALVKPALSSSP